MRHTVRIAEGVAAAVQDGARPMRSQQLGQSPGFAQIGQSYPHLGAHCEAGIRAAKLACEEEQLQFLDDTVVIRSLRPARDDDGQLKLRRVYAFEYSDNGDNRRPGSVTLLGQQVEYLHIRPQLYVVPKAPERNDTFH